MTDPLNLWSVTTLIKLGLGTSEGLVRWRSGRVAEAAYDDFAILKAYVEKENRQGAIKFLQDAPFQASSTAAARGTDLHKAAEAFALGQTPEVEDHILPYVEQYRRYLEAYRPEFLMSEAPVYNATFGYAGTCDGVVVIDGRPLVFDIKTTAHAPDSGRNRPPFSEVALQLVAYRRAELVGVLSEQRYASGKRYYVFNPDARHEPMPETDGAVCVVVSPFDYTVTPVRTDEQVWRSFRHVMEAARWQVSTSRNVFGPQISPPVQEVAA